jgi:hypothetical protein
MPRMNHLALAHQTGVRLAEIGFLLILFAGVWLAAAQVPKFKLGTARTIVAGVALRSRADFSSSPHIGVTSASFDWSR